jgi:hypothetical protein
MESSTAPVAAAFWIALTTVALISTLGLKLTVRLAAPKADNGWDNAIGYVLVSGLLLYFPVRWMIGSGSWALMLLSPLVVWAVQTAALKLIYEITVFRAWLLGLAHTLLTTTVTTALALATGVVLAYILYGQIISDPVRIIRIILRLIGIELPF